MDAALKDYRYKLDPRMFLLFFLSLLSQFLGCTIIHFNIFFNIVFLIFTLICWWYNTKTVEIFTRTVLLIKLLYLSILLLLILILSGFNGKFIGTENSLQLTITSLCITVVTTTFLTARNNLVSVVYRGHRNFPLVGQQTLQLNNRILVLQQVMVFGGRAAISSLLNCLIYHIIPYPLSPLALMVVRNLNLNYPNLDLGDVEISL
jgi:hypothetical protein